MYTKLFAKILDSSIWLENLATRVVWITILAAMDEDGMVQFATLLNLARRAGVSIDEAKKALEVLEGADEFSSDPDQDGRRIERVPGGWIVLNAGKYRELVSRNESMRLTRERSQRYRERKKVVAAKRDGTTDERDESANVTPNSDHVTQLSCDAEMRHESVTQTEVDTDSEVEEDAKKNTRECLRHEDAPFLFNRKSLQVLR